MRVQQSKNCEYVNKDEEKNPYNVNSVNKHIIIDYNSSAVSILISKHYFAFSFIATKVIKKYQFLDLYAIIMNLQNEPFPP